MAHRLAIIAIESGACVANPEYETEKECFDQINMFEDALFQVQLDSDLHDRTYIVPNQKNKFIFVVEPVDQSMEVL